MKIFFVFLFCCLWAAGQASASEKSGGGLVVICRSDLSDLALGFLESFTNENPGIKMSVKSFGDDKSLAVLRKEFPDALVIRDNISDDGRFLSPGKEFKMFALQGIMFLVNGVNPVETISREKLKALFDGKVIGWKELGGQNTLVHMYTYEQENSSLVRILKAVLQTTGKLSERALCVPDEDNMAAVVSVDPDAIGFVTFSGSVQFPDSHVLRIDGVMPSFSGMALKKYPFSRTVYIYIPDNSSGDARKYFEFVTGRQGRAVIAKNKMFPLIR